MVEECAVKTDLLPILYVMNFPIPICEITLFIITDETNGKNPYITCSITVKFYCTNQFSLLFLALSLSGLLFFSGFPFLPLPRFLLRVQAVVAS